jgi:anaphase-promoting complex subunit 7
MNFPLMFVLFATPVASFLITPITPMAPHIPKSQLHMSVPNPLDTLTSGLSSVFRFHKGVTAVPSKKNRVPLQLLELYDVENDSACRVVRERITELDLNVKRVIPAAPNSRVFQDKEYDYALPVGAQIPRLVVQDHEGAEARVLSGDADIVSFLNKHHTPGHVLVQHRFHMAKVALDAISAVGGFITNVMTNVLRLGRGSLVSEAASSNAVNVVPRPRRPLILYSYEGNQFCRLVREVFTELDIVYELRSVGKKSKRREELAAVYGGSIQCPYMIDPNTGVQMAESTDIIKYLYRTYALWTPPNEVLEGISKILLPWVRPILSALAPVQARFTTEEEPDHAYGTEIANFKKKIKEEVASEPVVIYTYALSPFCMEAKKLLDNFDIDYKEISLGAQWIPGLIAQGGSQKRAALLELTGQSSLPNIFVGGKSIGGLFSGDPGLVPALEQGLLREMVEKAVERMLPSPEVLAEAAEYMAKPAAAYFSKLTRDKLTRDKLQAAFNMTEDSITIVDARAFW